MSLNNMTPFGILYLLASVLLVVGLAGGSNAVIVAGSMAFCAPLCGALYALAREEDE